MWRGRTAADMTGRGREVRREWGWRPVGNMSALCVRNVSVNWDASAGGMADTADTAMARRGAECTGGRLE